MINHRLTCTAAIALAIAATTAPAASAMPADGPITSSQLPHYPTPLEPKQDLRGPDARDAEQHRGIYEPMAPEDQPQPPQDLRNPDTIDYADGRGTYNAPDVVVVEAPAPRAEPTATGIDWEDVGIGAGGLLGASLLALGGALLVVQRRGARAHAAH
jgi:hypothetical protein